MRADISTLIFPYHFNSDIFVPNGAEISLVFGAEISLVSVEISLAQNITLLWCGNITVKMVQKYH